MARSRLGSLVVDIAADVASLKGDMERGRQTVESALGGVTKAANFAKTALAGIGGALSVARFASAIKEAIDFGDSLKDLSTATGATVEQLSFLDFAAKQNGSSLDSLSTGLARLQRSLADVISGGGEKAANALRMLGMSAKDLAGQNILQQLTNIGDGLAKIENPAQRAQAAQALFGKSVQELLPLLLSGGDNLKQLIDRFVELNGTVTKEQAGKFDDFNDSIEELKVAARGAATAIGEQLAPSLTKLARAFADVVGKRTAMDELRDKANALRDTIKGVEAQISSGSLDPLNKSVLVPDVKLKPEAIESLKRNLQGYREELAATIKEQVKLIEGVNAKRDAILQPPPPAAPEEVDTAAMEKAREAERDRRLREELRISGEVLNQHLRDIDEEARYWDDKEKHKEQLRRQVESTPERVMRELKDFKDTFGVDSVEYGRRAAEAYDELIPPIKKAKSAVHELGLQFSSAFEDAIVSGGQLSDVIKGIEKDILRLMARKWVTEPLLKGAESALSSGGMLSGVGDWISKIFGTYAGARAGGGPVSGGRTYLVGEDGPELLTMGAAGVITPNGGAGGGDVTVNVYNSTGAPVSTRDRGVMNGERQVDVIVGASIARQIGTGAGARFGMQPALAAR